MGEFALMHINKPEPYSIVSNICTNINPKRTNSFLLVISYTSSASIHEHEGKIPH